MAKSGTKTGRKLNPRSLANLKRGAGPGRPKGLRNKATIEIKRLATEFVEDDKGRRKLLEQYRSGRLHPAILTMFFHYAYGKPKDTVVLELDQLKRKVAEILSVDPAELPEISDA